MLRSNGVVEGAVAVAIEQIEELMLEDVSTCEEVRPALVGMEAQEGGMVMKWRLVMDSNWAQGEGSIDEMRQMAQSLVAGESELVEALGWDAKDMDCDAVAVMYAVNGDEGEWGEWIGKIEVVGRSDELEKVYTIDKKDGKWVLHEAVEMLVPYWYVNQAGLVH